MKTLGIIGGIGPESTIEYYRRIISLYRQRTSDGHPPSIIINSIDMKKQLDMVAANELSLILRDKTVFGVQVLDTTQIHAEAAVARMLAGAS